MNDDGGAAFPLQRVLTHDGEITQFEERGMSLRDYLAAKAIALCAMNALCNAINAGKTTVSDADIARDCYAVADAMLKERAK